MTDSSTAIVTDSSVNARSDWGLTIALIAALTALADWLFFRETIGISLTLFVVAVAVSAALANRLEGDRRALAIYGGILVAALLPSLEAFNVMSALIAVLGISCFALGVTAALKGNLIDRLGAVGWHLVTAPFQFVRDLPPLKRWASQRGAPVDATTVQGWIIPVVLGIVFLALFAAANPVIALWFAQWRFGSSLDLDVQRVAFWLTTIVLVWAFVRAGSRFAPPGLAEPVAGASDVASELAPIVNPMFNDAAITRSLVLFNVLFAVQTVMDAGYLWGGFALPDGMSYATYAHRGAYPLIVTALLAAVFVVVAMRPGSSAERSPLMRTLVFLWVGQNVLLVVSAMLRLNLYVETYLLTYWRVAAFIWMLVVAAGLVLIVVRIVTCRSNAWLIAANTAVLLLTIYVCSFVNFAGVVAGYNVDHARGSASAGHPIDLTYLAALGPHAIPALDAYIASQSQQDLRYFRRHRDFIAARHLNATADWRAWTFRNWRLARYLENAKQP